MVQEVTHSSGWQIEQIKKAAPAVLGTLPGLNLVKT
jgi:hypothetical protein